MFGMPINTEFVSATGATSAMGAPTDRKISLAPLPSLAPKERASWRITVRGASAASARFKVQMNSDELTGEDVEETEATNFYE